MNKRGDWHICPETGVFLRALLQGFWQQGLLEHLADMSPDRPDTALSLLARNAFQPFFRWTDCSGNMLPQCGYCAP